LDLIVAKICLQQYENYEEHSQQARYNYGVMSLDKMCSYCENVVTPEEQQEYECPYCGEVAGLLDLP
jgi:Zn finger protein HypA/HybF involved in hydrogenase expression